MSELRKGYKETLQPALLAILLIRNESRGGSSLYQKCYRSSLLKKSVLPFLVALNFLDGLSWFSN
jgi:hypothetical protein